jgi:adenosyl cobinamide kinase/adenosyl cobinamide phosphate guanylyltransferase
MPLTVLIGGARSGKSELALRLAARADGPVVFVATAEALDDEMAARIARHKLERDPSWGLVEEPLEVERALREALPSACVVLDCLTLWVANLMGAGLSDGALEARARGALSAACARPGPTVAVTNEVGSGIVPADPATRRYRDLLGRVNSLWARAAERPLLMTAGHVVPLQRIDELVDG